MAVERITSEVRMEQQAVLVAGVLGATPEWPSIEDRIVAFEETLAAEPKRVDADELELRRALGLRG